MLRAIWYRHWMEMRGALLVSAVVIGILAAAYPVILLGSTSWYAETGEIVGELDSFRVAFGELEGANFVVWGLHTQVSLIAAILVGWFLAGSGVRTNSGTPLHPSVQYTLTLPVARFELLWTRWAAACAAVVVLFSSLLIVNALVALLMAEPVPIGTMALSSALCAVLVIGFATFLGMVMVVEERLPGFLLIALILALYSGLWRWLARFVAGAPVAWMTLAWILLGIGASLSVAALAAESKDF